MAEARRGRRRRVRAGSSVIGLAALAALALAGCGGGSGGAGSAARQGSGELRVMTVVTTLDGGVSVAPGIGSGGTPIVVEPGTSARVQGSAALPDTSDVCAVLGRNGQVGRVALVVTDDVMRVHTPAKCPGPRRVTQAVAIWSADDLAGTRLRESGIPGVQLCLEREGRLGVRVRVEAVGTAC